MSGKSRHIFEVAVPFLQLTDGKGHRHFLTQGNDLPSWVSDDQAAQLLKSGAVYRFGVI